LQRLAAFGILGFFSLYDGIFKPLGFLGDLPCIFAGKEAMPLRLRRMI
jgi:hypothetical protein